MSEFYIMDHKHWQIAGIKDLSKFFANLMILFPRNAYLHLEDGDPTPEIEKFLELHHTDITKPGLKKKRYITVIPGFLKIKIGSTCSMVNINHEAMKKLAYFADNYAIPVIADAIHVSQGGNCLLQWFDICWGDPISVAEVLPEKLISSFCKAIGTTYRLVDGD